jgi:TolB-like protein
MTDAVFLSYSRADQPVARRIADALRSGGIEVWLDTSELRGGDAWDQSIRRQIGACALFVPIISAHTQQRSEGYFRLEWRLAIERTHRMADGMPFLAPVVVDDTPESGAVVPVEFLRVQWMRLPSGLPTPAFVEQIRRMQAAPHVPSAARDALVSATDVSAVQRPEGPRIAAGTAFAPGGESGRAAEQSVAVLAFANLSQDPANEFFSDGISEELLNLLGRIPGVRVAASTSAFYFKGRNATIREIAATLGVAHIIEGSVRKFGSRVRISAKLINAADGFQLWSDSFDRELEDIFALQDEIAALIAQSLQPRLAHGARVTRAVNPEAHRLVLEGRHFWTLRTEAGFARAQKLFEAALQVDPNFADAHAGLAAVWAVRAWYGSICDSITSPDELQHAAVEARKAVEGDSSLPDGHAAAGVVAFLTRRWPEAEQCYREALRVNPNFAVALQWHSHLLCARGHLDRALGTLERSVALDPLARSTLIVYAYQLNFARRYADALAAADRAAALHEGTYAALEGPRAMALWSLGRVGEAVAAARVVTRETSWSTRWWAGEEALFVLCRAGAAEEAREQQRRWQAELPPGAPANGPLLHAIGRFEEALPYLEQLPPASYSRLHYHEIWDGVREDPRFEGLLARLGCAEEYRLGRGTLSQMLRAAASESGQPEVKERGAEPGPALS